MAPVDPTEFVPADPSPFRLHGGRVGVLLIHGFGGSASEVRMLGHALHRRGLTVHAPLLPGHGTTPEALDTHVYRDWIDHAEHAYQELREACDDVFLGGLSVGATLAVHLAVRSARPAGLVAYSPALLAGAWWTMTTPLIRMLVRKAAAHGRELVDPAAADRLWSYPSYSLAAAREVVRLIDATRPLIPDLSCPLLVFRSAIDATIPPESAAQLVAAAASRDKALVTLHGSGHVVTVDGEWRDVAERTWTFVAARSGRLHPAPVGAGSGPASCEARIGADARTGPDRVE